MGGAGEPRMALAQCQIPPFDGGLGMKNLYLYYLATRLLKVHDWFAGGWSDPAYRLELHTLGLLGIHGMLYGNPIPRTLPVVTRGVFLAWRASLRHTRWSNKLTLHTPL